MQHTIDQIIKEKVIVIVRGVAKDKLIDLAEAVYRGGVRLLECTYDATGNIPDEEIAENIGMLSRHFEGRMLIGAGTVIREKQVELTKAVGGKFVISPDANPDIIRKTKEAGLVSIPGALTPSEAAAAHRAGADFVKLFPISTLGVSYLKAITAPLSHIRFLAVGGVTKDNMKSYESAGACGYGFGGDIVRKDAIATGDWDTIEASARSYVEIAKQ